MNVMFDSLESRKLLAAVTATLGKNDTLTVRGTDASDHIVVVDDSSGTTVRQVNGGTSTVVAEYGPGYITKVIIDAKGGDDLVSIEVSDKDRYKASFEVYGNGGHDTLIDNNYNSRAKLDGGIGNDTLVGGREMYGGAGNDRLTGYLVDGYGQAEYMNGGTGNDTLTGNGGPATLLGEGGNDVISTTSLQEWINNVLVSAGDGNDTVYAAAGGDYGLDGGDDTFYFGATPFTPADAKTEIGVGGGTGNDRFEISYVNNSGKIVYVGISGDEGDDRIDASKAVLSGFSATGFDGRDTLIGTNAGDYLRGDLGDDLLDGNGGNDTLVGDVGNDTLYGRGGDDHLYGDGENDASGLYDGRDLIDGGLGNDTLFGGGNNDSLFGSDGNDWLYAGTGTNRLYGQKGVDRIFAKNGTIDTLYDSTGDVVDRDANDILA